MSGPSQKYHSNTGLVWYSDPHGIWLYGINCVFRPVVARFLV
jgi:hypothetical protein